MVSYFGSNICTMLDDNYLIIDLEAYGKFYEEKYEIRKSNFQDFYRNSSYTNFVKVYNDNFLILGNKIPTEKEFHKFCTIKNTKS